MDTTEQTKSKNSRLIIICMIVIILLLGGLVVLLLFRGGGSGSAQSVTSNDGSAPVLTYANDGVTIIDDADALQEAVDEMRRKAKEGSVALLYQPNAYSSDGLTFDCVIGNSSANSYDMFIGVYTDNAFTDQVFLSGLIRPGEQFERITLERTLDSGEHTLYVAFTQVEEDLETLHSQTLVSMKFIVND